MNKIMQEEIDLPPIMTKSDGKDRRVGIELEFAQVGVETSANLVVEMFGGSVKLINPYKCEVLDTCYGKFVIELDTSLLKEKRYIDLLHSVGIDPTEETATKIESVLESLLSNIIPFEIVTPPIPIRELGVIEKLCIRLREMGAEGTRSSVLNAFGAHLNIEIARNDVEYILSHLRAFALLMPQLRESHKVDIARRISNYVKDYPNAYVEKILSPRYRPTLDVFITDYLECNPSRDRALDLTPLLAVTHFNEVKSKMQQPHLLNARPAFHYRLPNCEIDDPEWSIIKEWNRWVNVEKLAVEQDALALQSIIFKKVEQVTNDMFEDAKNKLANQ